MADRSAYYREYHLANRDRKIQKAAEWYASNKPRKQASDRARRNGPQRDGLLLAKRDEELRRIYGISLAEREQMIFAQDGLCGLCRGELGPRPHVDHDHTTGRVRGVLCHNCNVGLGHFHDDPERLRLALDYLNRHQGGSCIGRSPDPSRGQ